MERKKETQKKKMGMSIGINRDWWSLSVGNVDGVIMGITEFGKEIENEMCKSNEVHEIASSHVSDAHVAQRGEGLLSMGGGRLITTIVKTCIVQYTISASEFMRIYGHCLDCISIDQQTRWTATVTN